MKKNKIQITFISTGLNEGGAENMLYKVINNLNKTVFDINVISLGVDGHYKQKILDLNIPVEDLDLKNKFSIKKLITLAQLIKKYDPKIVQTWMYHADFLGGLIVKLSSNAKIFWGLRNSTLSIRDSSFSVIFSRLICIPLSFFIPDLIISCSRTSIKIHKKLGYKNDLFHYVPNGLNIKNISKNKFNFFSKRYFDILFCGRYDLQKNILFFLDVIKDLYKCDNNIRVQMIGKNIDKNNFKLVSEIKKRSLSHCIELNGFQESIEPYFKNSEILLSLSKYGEAFPNILLEAMAYRTVPVFFDVGDVKEIVGINDLVLNKKSKSNQISKFLFKLLKTKNQSIRNINYYLEKKLVKFYDIENIVKKYENIYLSKLNSKD